MTITHSQTSAESVHRGSNDGARSDRVRGNLQESRAEFEELFDRDESRNGFSPRSKTMQFLTSRGGLTVLAVAAGAVLLLRPGLTARVVRILPVRPLLYNLALTWLARR
jgi:hypothetical protein